MQERIDPRKRVARYFFDSLPEFARYLDTAPRTWRSQSSERGEPDKAWDLNTDYAQARKLCSQGWMEGAEKLQDTLKVLNMGTPAPATCTDFYGYMPHVPRYCAGAPDNMIRHVPNPRDGSGKVLTLCVPVNAHSDVKAPQMANFGLAVAHYVNQMETQGVRIELIASATSLVSGWRCTHAVRVKLADQPLDLAVISFAIGHPAMFRRLFFGARERCAAPQDAAYGHSENARVSDIINAPNGLIILNGMKDADRYASTVENAVNYVSTSIERAIEERGF